MATVVPGPLGHAEVRKRTKQEGQHKNELLVLLLAQVHEMTTKKDDGNADN